MLALHRNVISALRHTLDAVNHELRALEQDLGLCAECGEQPPRPLRQRAPRPVYARTPWEARGSRRVA